MSPAVYKYVVCSFRRQRKISYLEVKELKGRGGKGGKGRERRRGKEGRERNGREGKGRGAQDFHESERAAPHTEGCSCSLEELMLGPAWRQTSCVSQAEIATSL